MPETGTKLQRWLDLIAYLVGRRLPVAVDELMEGVPAYSRKWNSGDATTRDSVRRMFERDKDELRRAGIPLHTVRYRIHFSQEEVEGYQITKRDFFLPYLRLVQQATTSAMGTTGAAGGAGEASGRATAGTSDQYEPAQWRRHRRAAAPPPERVIEAEIGDEDAQTAMEALRRIAKIPGFPLAREARSAFRKLAFDLDPDAFSGAPVLFLARPDAEELSAKLRRISDSLLARKRLRFRYHGVYRGEATTRDVEPYGLLFQHGHWYLFAQDPSRGEVRAFRADRMEDVAANSRTPNTPDFEVPAEFRLDDYVNRQPWELGDEAPLTSHVLFRFPRSLWAARNDHGVAVEEREHGAVVRRFEVQQVNPFLRWLLSLEDDVILLDPPELVTELRNLARETAALYAPAEGDDA